MFEPDSRYYNLETANHTTEEGRKIPYKRRRFLPKGQRLPLLYEVTVRDEDRLDLIASQSLGDPQHFWRVADANNAMNPFDLIGEPGSMLRISVPQPQE